MAISSHKSESTVKTYTKKCPETKKRQMSDALSTKMSMMPTKCPKIAETSLENNKNMKPKNQETFDTNHMELVPVEDPNFDMLLSKFLDKTENQLALQNTKQAVENPANSPRNVLNQVNNVTNTVAQKNFLVPQMYFPHSSVTINYHFHS